MKILQCINDNKEWLFSGLGVVLITTLGTMIKQLLFKKKSNDVTKTVIKQKSIGKNNVQIGIQNNCEKEK